MANYNKKVRGLIEGLSDFWHLYFKEIDQLEVLFQGVDVLAGQSYLDLLSLLLNNSLQDTPLFNKEFFKHIFIKETELKYQQRAPLGSSVYRYTAEDNLVHAGVLTNKVLSATAALERDIDYFINARDRIFEFVVDPLNAYRQRTFGTGDAAFTLRTKIPDSAFSVQLLDDGSVPTTFTLNNANTELVIAYDGPANGATGFSRNIVASINTHHVFSGLLLASLVVDGTGNQAPVSSPLVPLVSEAVNPLDGYATRIVPTAFGGKFTCPGVADWTDPSLNVKKGDIIRFQAGAVIGRPVEFSIDTIRPDALYLEAEKSITTAAGSITSFSLLREPRNNIVINEPFSSSGVVVQSASDGALSASTQTFTAASAVFSPLHKGDIVELLGSFNTGYARIISVTNATTVVLAVVGAVDETAIPWKLLSTATGATYTDGTLTNNGDGTGTFSSPSAAFVAATNTLIKIYRAGVIEKYEVFKNVSATSVNVKIAADVAAATGLTWQWANMAPSPAALSFPFVLKDSVTLLAKRQLDGGPVLVDRDFSVNEDTATITPLTIWETSQDISAYYRYRLVLVAPGAITQPGTLATENVSVGVHEIAFWAPDALIDRFHLYNTFGYLIGRFENSSEAYRALIRGIFQLFMLGPTLERFESAVNTVANLPVIRDDGEILLSYSTEAHTTNTDGFLSGATKQFTASSGNFTSANLANYLYIGAGLNAGKQFSVEQVINSTTLLLDKETSIDGPVTWELSSTSTHTITTSRTTYAIDRSIPLKAKFLDSNNWGVLSLRAFDTITAAFIVTDYIESPTWWEKVTIPPELWEDEDASRRSSTPSLFENNIGASDIPKIGDPGFFLGADSQGFVPPSTVKYGDGGLDDGNLSGDLYYPSSNDVFFTTSTNALFSSSDTDHYLVVEGVGRFRILQVLAPNQLKIEAFENISDASGLSWEVHSQPIALRHKAAFIVLDTWLKHHLFSVVFNPVTAGIYGAELLASLEELVFTARPSYTYTIVRPSTLFQELIKINETFEALSELGPGGSAGEQIAGNAAPLTIGAGWVIGSWFRYISHSDTFSTPTALVSDVLGTAPAGYDYHPTKVSIDNTFVDAADNLPIPWAKHVAISAASGSNPVCTTVSGVSTITVGVATFTDKHLGAYIRITGTTTPTTTNNNRNFVIGTIVSSTKVVVGEINTSSGPYTLTDSTDGSWELFTTGSNFGHVFSTNEGESLFVDEDAVHAFNSSHVGTYARFIYTSTENTVFRIDEFVNASLVRLAKRERFHPAESSPDETGSVTGNALTATNSLFTPSMGYVQRVANNPATAKALKYYVVFNGGANTGERRRILDVIDAYNVLVEGAALTTDAAADFYLEIVTAYVLTDESTTWEHIENAVLIDENTLDLSGTPAQATVASVAYTAYGIRVPEDPTAGGFDATLGDTYYYLGMPNPRPDQGRSRSARDTDLREDPIQIKVT